MADPFVCQRSVLRLCRPFVDPLLWRPEPGRSAGTVRSFLWRILAARPADEALLGLPAGLYRALSSIPSLYPFYQRLHRYAQGVVVGAPTRRSLTTWNGWHSVSIWDRTTYWETRLRSILWWRIMIFNCPLKFGCRSFFIPAGYFSFPAKLIPLLNQHRVTTVFWHPFALGTIASLRALDEYPAGISPVCVLCGEGDAGAPAELLEGACAIGPLHQSLWLHGDVHVLLL